MRILIKNTQEGWKVRFPAGNPWKMPVGEWLPINSAKRPLTWFPPMPAHVVSAQLMARYPGSNVFTLVPLGEDLEQ